MKKVLIAVISVLLVFFISIGSYVFYDLFVSDDYSAEKYSQTWVSDDEKFSFVTTNKKGLCGSHLTINGSVSIGKQNLSTTISYCPHFTINYGKSDDVILSGDYFYIPLIKVLIVDVDSTSYNLKDYRDKKLIFHVK